MKQIMNRSVSSLVVVILFAFFSAQVNAIVGDQQPLHSNLITWDDLKVNLTERYNLNDKDNNSTVIVVAKDGTGDSYTVQGAVDMVPDHNTKRVKILILPGIYRERVYIPSHKPYVSFIGIQPSETVITFNAKAADKDANGRDLGTFRTATVDVESDYFCATGITFQNTIMPVPKGKGKQAVALKISGDKAVFFNVNFLGGQDTLYDLEGSHYFYRCFIEGMVDFIFGNGRSLYEECVIHSIARKSGAIAASHRNSAEENTGFSFLNCKINGTGRIYLGRAWGRYSRAIYIHCHIDNIITPKGWNDFGDASRRKTVTFGEYGCGGRGSYNPRRVSWSKLFTHAEITPFYNKSYIDGKQWLRL